MLLSGFRLNDREIKPENSVFLRKYFDIYAPKEYKSYQKVTNEFLTHSYSKYLDLKKGDVFLSKMNYKGRLEIYKFLSKKLHYAIENLKKVKDIHPSYETLLYNKLTKYIIYPSQNFDFVNQLKGVLFTGQECVIDLDIQSSKEPTIRLRITYDDLRNILTKEMLFTMFFYSHSDNRLSSTSKRESSGYYIDFDLPWKDGLDEKTIKAFEFYVEMFEKAPRDQVTLEFYFSLPRGISTSNKINNLPRGFNRFEITFDKSKQDQLHPAVLSMIFWMALYPDIFVAAESGGKYFSYCDAFGLKDHDHVSSSGYDYGYDDYNLDGQFLWTDSSGDYTPAKYLALVEKFKNEVGITPEDIIYIRGCHNHELSEMHATIIEYAAHKYLKHLHDNRKYRFGMIHNLRKIGGDNAYLTWEQFEGEKK